MRTLRKYVSRSFYGTFLATVAVLTFIISIGGLFKITDLLSKGIEAGPILRVFLSGIPDGIAYAVPVGTLTAALLVFGRLSGDSEVTAMRACGVSIARVAGWLFPFSLAAAGVCLYVNSELVPLQHYMRWQATSRLRADAALGLVEVGRTVQLSDALRVFVGGVAEDGGLEGIRIFDQREAGRTREIKADRGRLLDTADGGDVVLALENVTIDPFQFDSPGAAYSDRWEVVLAQGARQVYTPRDKHRNFYDLYVQARWFELEADRLAEVLWKMEQVKQLRQEAYAEAEALRERAWRARRAGGREEAFVRLLDEALAREGEVVPLVRLLQRQARMLERASEEDEERLRARAMDMRIVLNQRFLLSLSPILFLYFGIPMGIRPHRHEGTIGIGMSLVVVFLFYLVLMLMGEFKDHPQLRPDLLVWLPGVVLGVVDLVLLKRLR